VMTGRSGSRRSVIENGVSWRPARSRVYSDQLESLAGFETINCARRRLQLQAPMYRLNHRRRLLIVGAVCLTLGCGCVRNRAAAPGDADWLFADGLRAFH
jgi:hypothetical protein